MVFYVTTQRQAHEKKFDTALFQDEEEHQETQPQICHMSVKPEDANLTSLPLEAVQRVFRSAEALLSKENAIVQAPGSNKMAFLVESKTSKRPHYVFAERTGRITCENCPGWASAKLCKHAVAVGEKTQQLSDYIQWLRRRNKPLNFNHLGYFRLNEGSWKEEK